MVVFGADKKASQAPAFESVVGQRDLKEGLLAVAADDALDGLLIRGEKGTAKSTAVRALAELLPAQRAVADCPYGCPPGDSDAQCSDCRARDDPPVEERSPPLVTLPLGATRDRVVGTLSVADALAGDAEFDPGLLARANRGILYVDEVNLLDDHLVDVLLDAAASGYNRVERDGVTVTHPAEFTLVGTMNPEEGDLRPQFRDRFALQTEVTACEPIEERVRIIDRALGDQTDDADDGGDERAQPPADRLHTARELLGGVELAREFRESIAELCRDAGVDGHRADIATARAARTFAALDGRTAVLETDVERAATFALPHRLRSDPFESAPAVEDVLDDHFEDEASDDEQSDAESEERDGETEGDDGNSDGDDGESGDDEASDGDRDTRDPGSTGSAEEDEQSAANGDGQRDTSDDGTADEDDSTADAGEPQPAEMGDGESERPGEDDDADGGDATPLLPGQSRAAVGDSARPEVESPTVDTDGSAASGRATAAGTDRGATVRTERAEGSDTVDAAASVRAAARRGSGQVSSRDLRRSVRKGDAGTLVVFAIDASASMRPAMRTAKGCVLELLRDAYQARDEVAVVTFAGEDADVVLPPTDSVSLAARHLKDLPAGDRTPLPAGLSTAAEVLTRADPEAAVAVVVTDGKSNAAEGSPTAATRDAADRLGAVADRTVVVDAGAETRAGLTDAVASATDAAVVPLSALTAERIDAFAER
ncbi:VWA domain-containing protein [Haloarcula nitratireducens]|uniref:VWA domain-containing protein n=1 Tax=Haloarcula nitratireducens TaxID=2487749 RepID=A0AAW4PJ45_9EURY|nr:VWA domain-containing protein [Halomicroarcula nitratireducens]MBX0297320.1 VWA domain-containing protein [Halomicroarcula nitratireducens]